MNVRLKKQFAFSTGMVYDGEYHINQYLITVDMITNSEDHLEQNIAYERIKYWIHNVLNNSVLIPSTDDGVASFLSTGQRVVTVPEEPVDQIVGIMLYCKLNSIAEDRIIITDIEISSRMGDDMIFLHSDSENIGPFADDGWWQDPRPIYNDCSARDRSSKVVALGRPMEWKDIDLDWQKTPEESNTVVFADFKKNETE